MNKHSVIDTDLYVITMLGALFENGKHEDTVTFEGFVRKLPSNRNFLVFAGLEPLLSALKDWKITGEEIAYLKGLSQFSTLSEDFWYYLHNLRFTADVWAMPEGTVFFPDEPFIRITGPLGVVQAVETLVLSFLNYSTAVASKAARIRSAAGKATLSEFGFRRAPGPDAALLASRSAYIGGFDSTSNVKAGFEYNIPVVGTMAHSYIMSFDSEKEAFDAYGKVYPKSTALIDTYNPLKGLQNALGSLGEGLQGVRLDSGDKAVISKELKRLALEAERPDIKIVVSDDMNEYKIHLFKLLEAPIDGYGVGTELVNPGPLGGVFKLVEYRAKGTTEPVYKAKFSENKSTFPGVKQVYRKYVNNVAVSDYIALASENVESPDYQPLLSKQMVGGRVVGYETLDLMRTRAAYQINLMQKKYSTIDSEYSYDVVFSAKVTDLRDNLIRKNEK